MSVRPYAPYLALAAASGQASCFAACSADAEQSATLELNVVVPFDGGPPPDPMSCTPPANAGTD